MGETPSPKLGEKLTFFCVGDMSEEVKIILKYAVSKIGGRRKKEKEFIKTELQENKRRTCMLRIYEVI